MGSIRVIGSSAGDCWGFRRGLCIGLSLSMCLEGCGSSVAHTNCAKVQSRCQEFEVDTFREAGELVSFRSTPLQRQDSKMALQETQRQNQQTLNPKP